MQFEHTPILSPSSHRSIPPLYAKLVHFKVVTDPVTSPRDVYNAFGPSSTLAVKQGCSHSCGNQDLVTERGSHLGGFLFQAISLSSHLMPEGLSKGPFYSEDLSIKADLFEMTIVERFGSWPYHFLSQEVGKNVLNSTNNLTS